MQKLKTNGQSMFDQQMASHRLPRRPGTGRTWSFQPGAARTRRGAAMKKYLSQLRPIERRLVIGVVVVMFLVLNWLLVWPHFSDWDNLGRRLDTADRQAGCFIKRPSTQRPKLQAEVGTYESAGGCCRAGRPGH